MDKKRIIANNIAKLIYIRGFSQVKLGKMLGVSHTTIQNYLSCKTMPSEQSIEKLAHLAGITPEDFVREGGFPID